MKIGDSYDAYAIPAVGERPVLVRRVVKAPEPGEVLVRLRASSLNYRDAMLALAPNVTYPRVPMSDGCGEVIAVGDGVSRFAVGDRVLTSAFVKWLSGPARMAAKSTLLGDHVDGCLRQVGNWPEDYLVRAPSHLSPLEAATLPGAGVTAWRALAVETNIQPGDIVLLQGTGGVSIFGLQIAKLKGATVILISSSDEKLARAKSLGADHGVNYKTHPHWGGIVRELAGGRGVDVVLDVGGQATFSQSIEAVGRGATILPIGRLGGADLALNVFSFIAKDLRIQGMSGGSREDLENLCRAYESSGLRPVIEKPAKIENLPAELEKLKTGQHFGKVPLEIY